MDDMAQKVSDLVDSYAHPLDANVQLNVFRVVSCVRSLLTHANMVEKESPLLKIYPELARQRKIVLSALSRLILKGKELESGETPSAQDQQDDKNNIGALFMNTTTLNNNTNNRDMTASTTSLPSPSSLSLSTENTATNTDQVDHISNLADRLLNEIDIFETMTSSIPRETSTSTVTTDSYMTSRSSSLFQQSDTSRSSFSSSLEHIPVSNNSSSSSLLLRQHITEARHSNTFYSITGDADSILQIMLDHQTSIDELMSLFLMTLERFLENKNKRAAEILEVTRRAVDAVRSFLSVVEHVCSNDNRRFLNEDGEEENSELISLVLAKEYVYSSITNLVTAVRALTAGGTAEQDFGHLEMCCENVVHTTNECAACVRIGLDSMRLYEISRFNDVDYTQLSLLGKKISSLHALQHHHNQLSGLPEEAEQYRKELCDSVKSMDGIMRVKPSMSDSAIQSSFQKQETRPRAASLDSYKPTQLSNISPMAAAFPLPPAVNTETTSKETTKVSKKKKDRGFLFYTNV